VLKSFIGQGYYGTHTPGVILRNILENPAWYTAYTPYQAEISQGRMEALVNFQTMVVRPDRHADRQRLHARRSHRRRRGHDAGHALGQEPKAIVFVVAGDCHPQTIEVIQTRAAAAGHRGRAWPTPAEWDALLAGDYFAVLAQYPATSGRIGRPGALTSTPVHAQAGGAFIVAADLLALTLLTPPGEWAAPTSWSGTTQRFGMPLCNGGPHAAYMACRDEFKRSMPGRLVGVSVDAHGNPAYRLALQTREQHIRREKATSNICTAQVLPAVVASMYAVYHGPEGLKRIATRVATLTAPSWPRACEQLGMQHRCTRQAFDTLLPSTPAGATEVHSCPRSIRGRQPAHRSRRTTSASRWTRPPPATMSRCCGAFRRRRARRCPTVERFEAGVAAADSRRPAPHQSPS